MEGLLFIHPDHLKHSLLLNTVKAEIFAGIKFCFFYVENICGDLIKRFWYLLKILILNSMPYIIYQIYNFFFFYEI